MSDTPRFHHHPSTVAIARNRPLLIVDADEVILSFAKGFDTFLEKRGLYLDLVSYRLHGNVRRNEDKTAVLDIEVTALLDEFRTDLDWLLPVDGAQESLKELSKIMSIVILTNITAEQAPARLRNFERLGIDYPVLVNGGPKGPYVKILSERAEMAAFFVDDIPPHLLSAAEHAPHVERIHLVGDERLRRLLPFTPHANHIAAGWPDAVAYIRTKLAG